MSKDRLGYLTDIELHRKLLEYGLPNVPVTETTRDVLINQLRRRIKNCSFKRDHDFTHEQISDPKNHQPTGREMYSSPCMESSTINVDNARSSTQYKTYPNIYAPPPFLSTEVNDYYSRVKLFNCYSEKPSICNKKSLGSNRKSRRLLPADIFLNFRDSTSKKMPPIQSPLRHHEGQKFILKMNTTIKTMAPNRIKKLFSHLNEQREKQQTFVSRMLVITLFFFFTALAFFYMFMGPNPSALFYQQDTQSVLCNTQINQGLKPPDCIQQDNIATSLHFNNQLLKHLGNRARSHHCENTSEPLYISFLEFSKILDTNVLEKSRIDLLIYDVEHLILNNPHWNIRIVNSNGSLTSYGKYPKPALNEIFFTLLNPKLPVHCVLMKKMTKFFTIIGTGTIIGAVILICYSIFSYIKSHRRKKILVTNKIVSEIMKELIESSQNGQFEAIIVNHLRDKILPLENRKMLLTLWNEALKFLELNESRVQFGFELKNGEEVRTIKWISVVAENINRKETQKEKQWQSPAFNNKNQIVHPPTPCLKIRHMFDCTDIGNPNLTQLIFNAVREKVGVQCRICDIQLDIKTFCVYVRCATEEDAGIVYKEINGWWFDKRLVSIKFLRLERYFSRFPKCKSIVSANFNQ